MRVLTMTRNAPIGRILKNDYPSLLMLIFISVVWVVAIGGGVFGFLPKRRGGGGIEVDSSMMNIMLLVAVAVTILCGWLAVKRIGVIKQVIRNGPEVEGRIQSIGFFKDRGRVEFDYEYAGESYHAGNAIWKNRETTQLQDGDGIRLILDPDKPSRAFSASLYT